MNKNLKKSIISLSVVGLILGGVSVNTFAASGGIKDVSGKTGANAYTNCNYGGNYVETACYVYKYDRYRKEISGDSKIVKTYGAMSNNAQVIQGSSYVRAKGNHYVSGAKEFLKLTTWTR